jgi:hypothetical protein
MVSAAGDIAASVVIVIQAGRTQYAGSTRIVNYFQHGDAELSGIGLSASAGEIAATGSVSISATAYIYGTRAMAMAGPLASNGEGNARLGSAAMAASASPIEANFISFDDEVLFMVLSEL